MPNPVLDGAQQPVDEERMLLVDIHGRPRNGRKRIATVFQNTSANSDALVTDISPRVITGARNKLRNRILRFTAKRAAEAARLCISPPHPYTSTLENTVILGRSSCRQHGTKPRHKAVSRANRGYAWAGTETSRGATDNTKYRSPVPDWGLTQASNRLSRITHGMRKLHGAAVTGTNPAVDRPATSADWAKKPANVLSVLSGGARARLRKAVFFFRSKLTLPEGEGPASRSKL
jgi:hypothetical protein